MSEESIEVMPSEDNGNVAVDIPDSPNEEPQESESPVAPAETVEQTEPELFELPDGRKVDAVTLTKEWKENFLPDYTKKAQALAAIKAPEPEKNINNPLADPDFVPSSYAELAEAIRDSIARENEAREQAVIQARQEVEDRVMSELTDLKATDPNLNENALFLHATKYGFRDLKVAYQNMSDMNQLAKSVKQATANDIRKRSDPVSISPGATGTNLNPNHFETAVDFLRAQRGN